MGPAGWRVAGSLAFRVRDSHKAYARALELGAIPLEIPTGPMELRLPAIKGIGGAPLYLIDRFEDGKSIYDIDFEFIEGVERKPKGKGLALIDHLEGQLALAKPKRLRGRLLHVAGRITRSGRRRTLHLPRGWPWASDLLAAFARLRALAAPG